jgi:hypothetical protein
MKNVDLFSLQCVGKAIKQLDEFRVSEKNLRTKTNVKRVDSARIYLINVLFSNGYELQRDTYKVVKSQTKRPLVTKSTFIN